MAFLSRLQSVRPGNLGKAERVLSTVAGMGLLLSAARGRGLGRLARSGVGLSLLARGSTGYCAVKDAVQGNKPLGAGFKEQWQRLQQTVAGGATPTARLDSMEHLFALELQEALNAEEQLCTLAETLSDRAVNPALAARVSEYAQELRVREQQIGGQLVQTKSTRGEHADDAMRALVREAHKMAHIAADSVRDAAIASSLQRIIHYKIAGYGTIAAYAKSLGRFGEAAQFAQWADRDKAIDAELSELAKGTLNPQAIAQPTIGSPPVTH